MTALLPQVVTPPGPFNPQEISNLLWALAKLVDNGRIQRDQDRHLLSEAVTALLPQVQTHQDDFTSQAVSNLLWALAKLVNERTNPAGSGQPGLQAVTALLPQVVTPPGPFISQEYLQPAVGAGETGGQRTAPAGSGRPGQPGGDGAVAAGGDPSGTVYISGHISNLLWALAKLVDNGLLHLYQGDLSSQAVTALLPQVVTPPRPFKPQDRSPTCCGRLRNWWTTDGSNGIRATWPARR